MLCKVTGEEMGQRNRGKGRNKDIIKSNGERCQMKCGENNKTD
jgi:hypothetical protein